LNSKNGTMLLGARLQPMGPPTSVNHGDRLKMGDVFLRFELLQEGSASGR
ncbi:MAG: FHA domain-containing protein, partial [Verrucomicrobia bacterium]|nr:FHA domain-containing protein [Verrucomicrobiota bacterium]